MVGDVFGDGSGELERWVSDRWRSDHGFDDAIPTAFAPVPAGRFALLVDLSSAPGLTPLANLLPQLRALRRLITGARGLDQQDLRLPADLDKADRANPKGITLKADGDVDKLPERLDAVLEQLQEARDALGAILSALKPLYDAMPASADLFNPTPWTPHLPLLRDTLRTLMLHGLAEAEPRSSAGVTWSAARFLYEQGVAITGAVARRIFRPSRRPTIHSTKPEGLRGGSTGALRICSGPRAICWGRPFRSSHNLRSTRTRRPK
jgi:hypothetical protein